MPRCIKVALVTRLLHALHYQSTGIATASPVEAPAALDDAAPIRVECEADLDAALGSFARVVNARLRARLRRGGLGLQIPEGLRRYGLRCPRCPFEPLAPTEDRIFDEARGPRTVDPGRKVFGDPGRGAAPFVWPRNVDGRRRARAAPRADKAVADFEPCPGVG